MTSCDVIIKGESNPDVFDVALLSGWDVQSRQWMTRRIHIDKEKCNPIIHLPNKQESSVENLENKEVVTDEELCNCDPPCYGFPTSSGESPTKKRSLPMPEAADVPDVVVDKAGGAGVNPDEPYWAKQCLDEATKAAETAVARCANFYANLDNLIEAEESEKDAPQKDAPPAGEAEAEPGPNAKDHDAHWPPGCIYMREDDKAKYRGKWHMSSKCQYVVSNFLLGKNFQYKRNVPKEYRCTRCCQ